MQPPQGSRHADVQDFDWLRPGQSPNWRLVGEDEVDLLRLDDLARRSRELDGVALLDLIKGALEKAGL